MADSNTATLQVVIELLKKGDTNGAIQELQAYKAQVNDTSASLEKMMGIAKDALAGIATVEFFKSAVESAVSYNKTLAALNGTLKATGQYSDEYADQLKTQRKELEENTTATLEQVAAIQTVLISFGATKKDLPELTKGALDLATVMGTDGVAAASALGRALQGQDMMLTRLGFHFDENAGYTERLASLMDQLKTRVGGASEEFNKLSVSKVEDMQKAWHDLVRTIGEDTATILAPAFEGITKILSGNWSQSSSANAMMMAQFGQFAHGASGSPDASHPVATAGPSVLGPNPQTIAPPNNVQLQAQQAALKELQKTYADVAMEALSGLDRERAAALKTYQDRETQVSELQRKGELSDDQVEQNRDANAAAYKQKLKEIDDQEAAQKLALKEQEEKLTAEGLDGLQKLIAMENVRYDVEKQRIALQLQSKKITDDEAAALNRANDLAHQQAKSTQDKFEPTEKLQLLEQQLTVATQGASETRLEAINREFRARLDTYQQLLSTHQITEAKMTELTQKAAALRQQALAAEAKQGAIEIERANLTPGGFQDKQIEEQWNERIDLVKAYYEFEKAQAKGDQEEIDSLEVEKTYTVEQMEDKKRFAISQTGQLIQSVGQQAAQSFASGLGNATVQTIENFKDADKAWMQFAANFLSQIAEMIIQTEVLNAIKNSSLGSYLGLATGGQVIAAASGVAGVSEVSSPTYFPKFNVLAGEAGREALTVLSKPQMVNWGGVVAQLGNVGSNRLAIVNAETLQGLVQGRGAKMAASGVGPSLPESSSSSANGRLVIEVRVSNDAQAQIIQNSIQGAVTKVTQEMGKQGPLSSAVKKLSA